MSKMIQLRNVPATVHAKLKIRAAEEGLSLSDFLTREVTKVAERPSRAEILRRLESRPIMKFKRSPTSLLREERDRR